MSRVAAGAEVPRRRSPFADAWMAGGPSTIELAAMSVPARFPAAGPAALSPEAALVDLSFLPRIGVKGDVVQLFGDLGLPIPPEVNQWVPHRGGLVARLGRSEFLAESGSDESWTCALAARLAAAGVPGSATLAPVLRSDASLLLCGRRVHELFAQVCSYPLHALAAGSRAVIMTQMIGVSVTLIRRPGPGPLPAYRLWCDPSFGDYLWRTLANVAAELGGAPLGWEQLTAVHTIEFKQRE